jgi:hypothetical protein
VNDYPEIRERIYYELRRVNMSKQVFADKMTMHAYPLLRASVYPILKGQTKLNQHMLDTMAVVFSVPRTDLVSDEVFNTLPARPVRYATLPVAGTDTLLLSDGAKVQVLLNGMEHLRGLHRKSVVSDRCSACGTEVYPCDEAEYLDNLLRGTKGLM